MNPQDNPRKRLGIGAAVLVVAMVDWLMEKRDTINGMTGFIQRARDNGTRRFTLLYAYQEGKWKLTEKRFDRDQSN